MGNSYAKLIKVNDEWYQRFCLGRYDEPVHRPLTKDQQSIYNLARAGFGNKSIAKRMSITAKAVTSQLKEIEYKGWEL